MALALGPFDKWFSVTKLSLELAGRAIRRLSGSFALPNESGLAARSC